MDDSPRSQDSGDALGKESVWVLSTRLDHNKDGRISWPLAGLSHGIEITTSQRQPDTRFLTATVSQCMLNCFG